MRLLNGASPLLPAQGYYAGKKNYASTGCKLSTASVKKLGRMWA